MAGYFSNPFSSLQRLRPVLSLSTALLSIAGTAQAQYVGKVAESKQPVLRAIAVYQYTGSLLKPNASRLVPVAVWDGEHYQPGSLYLARPEPLAVAPGTQYVLEQSGLPQGLFDVGSASQLNGSWVGLGRVKPEAAPPPPPKLHTARQLPVLTGGAGKGKAGDAPADSSKDSAKDSSSQTDSSPTLHRKTDPVGTGDTSSGSDGPTLHRRDSSSGSGGSGSEAGSSPAPDPDRPTLHRKDDSASGTTSDASSDTPTLHRKDADTSSNAPAPDPDRPTLHRHADASTDTASSAPDPDRPTLHRHADPSAGTAAAPDPDRPHLRYGAGADNTRAQPALLSDSPLHPGASPGASPSAAKPGDPLAAAGPQPVPVAATVAVSDVRPDEPRSFRYSWPSLSDEADVRQSMHSLAMKALAGAVQGSFGPAAGAGDAALKQAATASAGSFGPAAHRAAAPNRKAQPSGPGSPQKPLQKPLQDPLQDADLSAWELAPGAGTTFVYSAHTAMGSGPNPIERYVTVIAQADFAGKPQPVFSQTTRSDTLAQTPALHLLDAVDTDGDHRAELLFGEQTAANASPSTTRAFAIYSLASGKAKPVFATDLGPAE